MSDAPRWPRRDFLGGSAATIAGLGLLPGCPTKDGVCVTDPDLHAGNAPANLSLRVPILSGKTQELEALLTKSYPFSHSWPGIHFARLLIQGDYLWFMAIYDDDPAATVNFLDANAGGLDPIFSLCEGWPAAGADRLTQLQAFVKQWTLPTTLLYSAYQDTGEEAVREAVTLRTHFLELVQGVQRAPNEYPALYNRFLAENRERIDMFGEKHPPKTGSTTISPPPESTNAFPMLSELKPDRVAPLKALLTVGEWAIEHLHVHPLSGMNTLHYARFIIVENRWLMFASVYDGDWLQYVDDFGTRIPKKLDEVWGNCVGYPEGGAANTVGLNKFLIDNTIDNDVFYGAYLGTTVKNIRTSVSLGDELWKHDCRTRNMDTPRALEEFQRLVRDQQLLLG